MAPSAHRNRLGELSTVRKRTFKGPLAAIAVAATLVLITTGCQPADWEEGGQHRPWYCDPTDTAINDGHEGHGDHGDHDPHYTVEKGPLSGPDCLSLHLSLNRAQTYAKQFPTKADAEANGFHFLAPWIPGQGTHHVNIEAGVTDQFDPDKPNMLMYDGNGPNAKLTGMVWVVDSGHMPPEGFPGDNDHWHAHEKLCFTPGEFIVGDNISDAQCTARGGVNRDTSEQWMVHVWLPTYAGWQATDIFNKDHPNI